ncbi:magnesium and cobalt transport protein CorA [Kineococcus gypseus]|uniref:magnesium and cobalt transport protein CorA n=1 Tax=Kineococcus gypseus TaxID=1637102 RepID=UPI003D7D15E5
MITDVATYTDGRRERVEDLHAALASCRRGERGFVWVRASDPDAAELEHLAAALELPALAVEDALQGHQRPKIERYGDVTFVVLKALAYYEERSAVETGEVLLFTSEHFVVSVRNGAVASLDAVREAVDVEEDRLRRGPRAVMHAVVDHVVGGYLAIDEELERDVEEMEEQVFSPRRSSDAERIYSLKREVLEVRRAAAPLVAPVRALLEQGAPPAGAVHGAGAGHGDGDGAGAGDGHGGHGDEAEQAMFVLRDVLDDLVRTVEHVEGYDRLLTDILNAHLAQVSVRQNDDMRKISAVAAMVAAPTLIAGVYGMNFQHMPELGWRLGYPASLLLMVGISLVLYRRFKRSGWL